MSTVIVEDQPEPAPVKRTTVVQEETRPAEKTVVIDADEDTDVTVVDED